jgi:hypothetical protein
MLFVKHKSQRNLQTPLTADVRNCNPAVSVRSVDIDVGAFFRVAARELSSPADEIVVPVRRCYGQWASFGRWTVRKLRLVMYELPGLEVFLDKVA